MKNKLFTFLWSVFLAFIVSFSAVGGLVTAFGMDVSLWVIALWCGFGAVLCSVCYSVPLGLLPVSTMALICGFLWQQGRLRISWEALLYRLSRQYDRAYDWGIIKLNHLTADDMEQQLWLILGILGVLIAMGIAWAVCRKKTAAVGLIPAGVLFAACFVVTDTVPKIPLIYLFLLGTALLLMTGAVRRQDEKQGNRLCTVLIAPLAVALMLLFTAIPASFYRGTEPPRKLVDKLMESETVAQLFGKAVEMGTSGSSVDSGIVNLKTVGMRVESNAEIMQVLTDYSDTLYLRGRALDTYDGLQWTDSGVVPEALYWPDEGKLSEGGVTMITTRYAHRMLYLPYYTQSLTTNKLARGIENEKKLTQYTLTCRLGEPVENRQTGEDLELEQYLHLTEDVLAWAVPMVEEITQGQTTVHGKAQAIGDYVRSSAKYSTNTHRMPSGSRDFVKWFLEDSETGYCVHYASAATVLLQAAGIPARYVTGYTVTVRDSYPVTVRAKDAHAWTEYWQPKYGWVILEATAPEEAPEPVVRPTGGAQATVGTEEPTEPVYIAPEGKPQVQKPEKNSPFGYLWILLVLAGLVGIVISQRTLRLSLKKKRLERGNTNERTLACWAEVARLSRLLGQLPDPELYSLAEKAKFSQHAITEEELDRCLQFIEERKALLKKRSVFHQLWYRLILAVY